MPSTPSSPFDLPGVLPGGPMHPMAAGLDMMRSAWQQWAGSGLPTGQMMAPALTLQELDRRIADLRAVEQWLRLHQSVVASSLQGLEMQRIALSTVQACMGTAAQAAAQAGSAASPAGDTGGTDAPAPAASLAADAAQQWFQMLQNQFNQLAAATAGAGASPTAPAAAPQAGAGEPAKPARAASRGTRTR